MQRSSVGIQSLLSTDLLTAKRLVIAGLLLDNSVQNRHKIFRYLDQTGMPFKNVREFDTWLHPDGAVCSFPLPASDKLTSVFLMSTLSPPYSPLHLVHFVARIWRISKYALKH